VAVLARADSPDSLRIANAYLAARGIPADHLILLPYRGSPHTCAFDAFDRDILQPTRKALKERKLDKTVHVWATTLGLPWRVDGNSSSSVIHFGKVIQPTKGPLIGPAGFTETNHYSGVWLSIDGFNSVPQSEHRPLHMHLAAGTVDLTLAMIKRSAAADGTFPAGTFYLCDGAGPRSTRKISIPQATRFLHALGAKVEHFAGSQFVDKKDVLGVYTGDVFFPTTLNKFLPGALADHLTSTGGVLDATGGQMMCTNFLDAGCAASYGTVVEPYNYPTKFPAALVHAAYRAGFTAVESYWMSVSWPEQGIFVGDPLCRPFGKPPEIAVASPTPGQFVADELPIEVKARAPHGVGGLEVRLDGEAVAGVGQQRLPKDASITLTIGTKKYTGAASEPTVLATLTGELKKKLEEDGFDVNLAPASLIVYRKNDGPPPSVAVSCTSGVLHGEIAGGKFFAGASSGEKDFMWLRFSTGPTSTTARTLFPLSKVSDGLHHLTITAVGGGETTAGTSQTLSFVKRTQVARLKLKRVKERISLAAVKGRVEVATASFQGGGLVPPIEFRVDERIVETRPNPSFTLSVDPKLIGVGRHFVRARTTKPLQEADDEVEFFIDP